MSEKQTPLIILQSILCQICFYVHLVNNHCLLSHVLNYVLIIKDISVFRYSFKSLEFRLIL